MLHVFDAVTTLLHGSSPKMYRVAKKVSCFQIINTYAIYSLESVKDKDVRFCRQISVKQALSYATLDV